MEYSAYKFWERVDTKRGKTTLSEIAEKTGVKEQRIAHLRSEVRYPKLEDCILIAGVLNTSLEYLVYGDSNASLCTEAKFVNENTEAQTLIRAIMKDPALLRALSLAIKSTERVNVRQEGRTS